MYETKESKDWKKRFQAYLKRELRKQKWDKELTGEGHWFLDCVFVQARTNQDSNNYYKILCDSMSGIITIDDKNVLVRTQKVMYDAKKPRFKAILHKAGYIGVFNNKESFDTFFNNNCMNCKKNRDKCTILRKAKEGRLQEDIVQEAEFTICQKRKL